MKTGKGVISTLYTMSYDVMGITQASVQGGSSHERLIIPTLITQRQKVKEHGKRTGTAGKRTI